MVSEKTKNLSVSSSQMRILNKVMLVPKLFCVFPFYTCNGRVRTSHWLMPVSLAIMCLSTGSSLWQTFNGPPGTTGWSEMSTKISRGADTIHNVYSMASILNYAMKMRKVNRFIQKLSEARKCLAGVGYSKKISVSYQLWWIDLSILLLLLSLNLWDGSINTMAMTMNFYYNYASGSALVFLYCSFMNIIGNQLEFLNDKTQLLVQERYFKGKTVQLAKFSDVHHAFCSAAEALQESHGYPLVILFLSFFIKILVYARSLISNVTSPNAGKLGGFIKLAALLVPVVMKICMIVRNAANTSRETKRFNQLLLENVVIEPNRDWNIKLDLHLALNHEVNFSAAGFFLLDYPVLHSMLAMITSFLVVMIQTDHSGA